MQAYGLCPKCKRNAWLTRHHIYPQRYYRKQRHPAILYLCRECHNQIERIIPSQKLRKDDYLSLCVAFLT